MPDKVRRRTSGSFDLTHQQAGELIGLMAGLHDLGKASPGFQAKAPELFGQISLNTSRSDCKKPHASISTKILWNFEGKGQAGWKSKKTASIILAQILGAHHGIFPRFDELDGWGCDILGDKEWSEMQIRLCKEVSYAIRGEYDQPVDLQDKEIDEGYIVPILAGLISVADWIGSSAKYFELATHADDLSNYPAESQDRSKQALEQLGWLPRPQFAEPKSFRDQYEASPNGSTHGFTPNKMQLQVANIVDQAKSPYLLFVESSMGSGKTEAAFYAIDRALTTKLASGFYFALPTQATGNAMYERVRYDYLENRGHSGPLNLQLVHGNQLRAEELTTSQIYDGENNGDENRSRVIAQSWFTPKKQALLAPFGVGTIDQLLLSVLQTKHWFVRMFGLAGKIIVFDEVHAYDVYMMTIFKRLLNWLGYLDCTVVMLSATLPDTKRRELADAYISGQGWKHINLDNLTSTGYPRLTYISQDSDSRAVDLSDPDSRRTKVECQIIPSNNDSLIEAIQQDMPNGGCAAIICNTVNSAQERFRELSSNPFFSNWEIILLHARMPQVWRQDKEDLVKAKFGKASDQTHRPAKAILIGTQVIEQSLDYDVDWMASEMAPIDLLFQRMGRLYRHQRDTRPVDQARFKILCDTDPHSDQEPVFDTAGELIYSKYVLLRSWVELIANKRKIGEPFNVNLPDDIDRMVQAAYAKDFPECDEPLRISLEAALKELTSEITHREHKADTITIGFTKYAEDLIEQFNHQFEDDDDPAVPSKLKAATRDGDDSITVICCGTDEDGNPLADAKRAIKDKEDIKKLLVWSLPISNKSLFYKLRSQDVPTGWDEHSPLRYCRKIEFVNGVADVDGVTVRINCREGIVFNSTE